MPLPVSLWGPIHSNYHTIWRIKELRKEPCIPQEDCNVIFRASSPKFYFSTHFVKPRSAIANTIHKGASKKSVGAMDMTNLESLRLGEYNQKTPSLTTWMHMHAEPKSQTCLPAVPSYFLRQGLSLYLVSHWFSNSCWPANPEDSPILLGCRHM